MNEALRLLRTQKRQRLDQPETTLDALPDLRWEQAEYDAENEGRRFARARKAP